MRNILITGVAGFIGFHLAKRLLENGDFVIGFDNLNNYYDPILKKSRLNLLYPYEKFEFYKNDLEDRPKLTEIFQSNKIEIVIHLAAQAGVRYSITNPGDYISSNIVGFYNILETIRANPVKHFIYASSSSVYGGNEKIPFSTIDFVDRPVSLYAATKKSNELMAYSYSHLYNIASTGLRFFTVYGPWGRPDMALYKFAMKMVAGEPIEIYNNGEMKRDFTYVDDVVECVFRFLSKGPQIPNNNIGSKSSTTPHEVYNIGSNNPVSLLEYVDYLEKHLGIASNKQFLPIQPGDVKDTYADISDLVKRIDYSPSTNLDEGVKEFVTWFKNYHKI